GEQEDARAVVEQAIKAHGGADALNKAQTLTRSGSGTMAQLNSTVPLSVEEAWGLPDRGRLAVEIDKKFRVIIVINGDKGWQSTGGPTADLSGERLGEYREELNVLWLLTLTPLLKDEFKLATLPEIKVNGEPAVGVKATAKGRGDV